MSTMSNGSAGRLGATDRATGLALADVLLDET
jgi:hypothetical protein